MKILVEYDEKTGVLLDANGMTIGTFINAKSFPQKNVIAVTELIKLGVSPDDIIKMKNQDLFN